MDMAAESTSFAVKAHDRAGFAHFNYSGVGAYKDDGTLKENAKVLYVTSKTAKTVTCDVVTDSKGKVETFTGLQAIIDARQKGYDTTPLVVRIVGTIEAADMDYFSSSAEGLQIKGKNADSEMNITLEGVGDDATIRGFGILLRNCKSVEIRNLAIMLCMDDCLSLDTDNSNCWIHNIDFFYGKTGSAADQAKGEMRGLYQMINQQFLIHEFPEAEIVNREDDMGLPGLRQAKMSYAPMDFARKYRIKQLDFEAQSAE